MRKKIDNLDDNRGIVGSVVLVVSVFVAIGTTAILGALHTTHTTPPAETNPTCIEQSASNTDESKDSDSDTLRWEGHGKQWSDSYNPR